MSRGDYRKIAAALRHVQFTVTCDDPTWIFCVHEIANTLQSDNSNFNRQKFYRACGLMQEIPTQDSQRSQEELPL